MKKREFNLVLHAADKIKLSIEQFNPNIPMLVGLRKTGM
jgi:hypothetical protein